MDIIEGELTCVICSLTMTEPHQYPCGHSYCLSCITAMRQRQDYRCPECREVFPRHQDIIKNYRLANIAEAYRNSSLIEYSPVERNRSGDSVTWQQALMIIIAVTFLLKVLTYMLLDTTEKPVQKGPQPELEIVPANLEPQDGRVEGLFGLLWLLTSFPIYGIWKLLSGIFGLLFWLISSIFFIVYFVINGLLNILVSIIALAFTVLYQIVNIFAYVVGWVCILGLMVLLVKMNN